MPKNMQTSNSLKRVFVLPKSPMHNLNSFMSIKSDLKNTNFVYPFHLWLASFGYFIDFLCCNCSRNNVIGCFWWAFAVLCINVVKLLDLSL